MTRSTTHRTRHGGPVRAGAVRADGVAEMWIFDEIGWYGVTAAAFIADLRAIGDRPVRLHINSPGGDAFDGLAIYEQLRQHPAQVTVHVEGLAASAASVIAMAANELVMAPASMLMIHDASSMTWGNEADHLATASLLGQVSDLLADIYAARAGGLASQWRALMRSETWYTPTEAIDAGLADRVAEAPPSSTAAARTQRAAALAAHHRTLSRGAIGATARESIRGLGLPVGGLVAARTVAIARPRSGRRPGPSARATVLELARRRMGAS